MSTEIPNVTRASRANEVQTFWLSLGVRSLGFGAGTGADFFRLALLRGAFLAWRGLGAGCGLGSDTDLRACRGLRGSGRLGRGTRCGLGFFLMRGMFGWTEGYPRIVGGNSSVFMVVTLADQHIGVPLCIRLIALFVGRLPAHRADRDRFGGVDLFKGRRVKLVIGAESKLFEIDSDRMKVVSTLLEAQFRVVGAVAHPKSQHHHGDQRPDGRFRRVLGSRLVAHDCCSSLVRKIRPGITSSPRALRTAISSGCSVPKAISQRSVLTSSSSR